MENIVFAKSAGTHCSCRAAALRRARALVLVLDDLSSRDRIEGRTLKLLQFYHFCKTLLMSFTKFHSLLP